jgi:hypothetical protein
VTLIIFIEVFTVSFKCCEFSMFNKWQKFLKIVGINVERFVSYVFWNFKRQRLVNLRK